MNEDVRAILENMKEALQKPDSRGKQLYLELQIAKLEWILSEEVSWDGVF